MSTIRGWARVATAAEIQAGTSEEVVVTPKGLTDAAFPVPPAVATGAELTTGTDNAKFASALALADAGITPIKTKASGAEVTTGTDDVKFATAKALADAGVTPIKVKASGAEVTTGTDDDKFVTAKALTDAGVTVAALTPPVKASAAELNTGTDDAKFATALGLTGSNFTKAGPASALTTSLIPASDGGITLGNVSKYIGQLYLKDYFNLKSVSRAADTATLTQVVSLYTTGASDRTQTINVLTAGDVRVYIKIDSGAGAMILSPSSGVINGAATLRTTQQYAWAITYADGTNVYAFTFGTWT